MYKVQPFTKNRLFIYHLLKRAKKFHLPVSSCWEMDCTEASQSLRDLRRQGVPGSFSAFLVKATAQLLEQYPHLNSHLFTKWNGRKEIVQFENINCNLVIQRKSSKSEDILLPLTIEQANKKSIREIEEIIQHHKTAPLEDLPQFAALERLKKMPNWLLSFISYKTRSDPNFYMKHYGTYGLSTLYSFKSSALSGSTVANTAIAFLPYSVAKKEGAMDPQQKTLRIGIVMDHYVLDGAEMSEAGYAFQRIIENPSSIIKSE